jgi:hypothetical protein
MDKNTTKDKNESFKCLCIGGALDGKYIDFKLPSKGVVIPALTPHGLSQYEYEYVNGVLICITVPDEPMKLY